MGLITSIVKSVRLKRLSKTLEGRTGSAFEMLKQAQQREKALEALLDLCLAEPNLKAIVNMHGSNRGELKAVYRSLNANGAGKRVRGHFVVASVFAFGATLDYALTGVREGFHIRKVASELVGYFEDGRMGIVVPGVGKLNDLM